MTGVGTPNSNNYTNKQIVDPSNKTISYKGDGVTSRTLQRPPPTVGRWDLLSPKSLQEKEKGTGVGRQLEAITVQ